MQATATRQDSMQATDTDVPRETTRASTTFGFTRRSFCGGAAACFQKSFARASDHCGHMRQSRQHESRSDVLKAFNQVNYAPAIRFPLVSVLSFPRVSIPKSS